MALPMRVRFIAAILLSLFACRLILFIIYCQGSYQNPTKSSIISVLTSSLNGHIVPAAQFSLLSLL